MKIDKELVERVAKVSRLSLSEEEKNSFIKDFKEILVLFSRVDSADVKNIELSVQPIKVENIFREDKVQKSLEDKKVFLNTEHKEKGFFKGPRIL